MKARGDGIGEGASAVERECEVVMVSSLNRAVWQDRQVPLDN